MRHSLSLPLRAAALAAWLLLLPAPVQAGAETVRGESQAWIFRSRAVLTGNSDHSVPPGVTVYSAITLEAALGRRLGRRLAAELALRTESREFDRAAVAGPVDRLGSLELLPITLTLHYRTGSGRLHPYAGLGANLTVAWEKSGMLDSLDMKAHVGPAVQLGLDLDMGSRALLNFNVGWNTLTTDIRNHGEPVFRLKIDPIALGAGVGFRF